MEEPRTKRSIFAPVVLILLTFSLIGNVFLYSKMIQNDQTDRVDRGTTVLQSGNDAAAFLNEAASQTEALSAAPDAASRMTAKSKLLAAYRKSEALTLFIHEAEDVNGKPFTAPKRGAADFLDQTLSALQTIGNHEGPLAEGEKAYLEALLQVFKACQQEMASFSHDTINQEQALAILVDKQWPQIAGKLLAHMNEPDDLAYKG